MQSSRSHTKSRTWGFPERWSNFTVFSSEVSRLVLLSERGRTHGSIWGVPPFLEGVLRATVATTMTTSYFYSYIETTSYQTTYTITVKAKQTWYSLAGEWWETDDGKNWRMVTSAWGRRNAHWHYSPVKYFHADCRYGVGGCWSTCQNKDCFGQDPPAVRFDDWPRPSVELPSLLTANGKQILGFDRYDLYYVPVTQAFMADEAVTVAGVSYTVYGYSIRCYYDEEGNCIEVHTEWGKRYDLHTIELVDWDTGEVYVSVNQTSLTFNIKTNTIVRFKYVLVDSWSRVVAVIIHRPPPPPIDECPRILNEGPLGDKAWCHCAERLNPEAFREHCEPPACLKVSVDFCCPGPEGKYSCLESRSGQGGKVCKRIQQPTMFTVSWSASWSLKSGWTFDDVLKVGPDAAVADCKYSRSSNSANGDCSVNAQPETKYSVTMVVVFKKT